MASILITGVSTGIGRGCANLYAQRGWQVIGTVRDATKRPEGLDERVRLEPLDLAVSGSAAALAQRLLAADGCPDVLLNNAGIAQRGPIEFVPPDELERLYQVNVFGQLEIIRALLPAMRNRGSGTIANVTSLGGTLTFPFFGVYNSTKWALEGLSEGLWHELKPFGIRVKAIEPGFVETAVWDKVHGNEPGASDGPYARFMQHMLAFESGITKRTTADECAVEIAAALADTSDRLRYPVAAYARPMVLVRRVLGAQFVMRFFHGQWMDK